jgi:hypothetical protein
MADFLVFSRGVKAVEVKFQMFDNGFFGITLHGESMVV